MDNSIYIALSRQLAVMRDMTVTANNVANVSTPGYNAEKMMFTDYLVKDGNRHRMAFAQDISTWRETGEGKMEITGNPLDLAIKGPGYFVVETAQGLRYTKAGQFMLDANGTIVTADGFPVTDNDGGRVTLEEGDGNNIEIGENGIVRVITQGGAIEERGVIGMVEFADEEQLTRLDNQLYEAKIAPQEPVRSRMMQGVIEGSNVSGVSEVVRLTELSRSTSGTAKFIEVMYDLQRKASNTYARAQQR